MTGSFASKRAVFSESLGCQPATSQIPQWVVRSWYRDNINWSSLLPLQRL